MAAKASVKLFDRLLDKHAPNRASIAPRPPECSGLQPPPGKPFRKPLGKPFGRPFQEPFSKPDPSRGSTTKRLLGWKGLLHPPVRRALTAAPIGQHRNGPFGPALCHRATTTGGVRAEERPSAGQLGRIRVADLVELDDVAERVLAIDGGRVAEVDRRPGKLHPGGA